MATEKDGSGETGGFKKFVFALVGTCCLGLTFGFGVSDFATPIESKQSDGVQNTSPAVLTAGQTSGETEAQVSGAGTDAADGVPKGPFEIVQLPPIITNIADPPDVWVRLEGNLVFDKSREANSTLLSAKLAQHVMAYLNTLKLADMQGAGAIHAVSQDLDEIVRSLSDGQVQGLLLSGLVFE